MTISMSNGHYFSEQLDQHIGYEEFYRKFGYAGLDDDCGPRRPELLRQVCYIIRNMLLVGNDSQLNEMISTTDIADMLELLRGNQE